MPTKSPAKRIALLAGSSLTWREQVSRGVASYAAVHGDWQIYSAPEGAEDSLFFTESYAWDGLIVRVTSERQARRIMALGVPAVSIGSVKIKNCPLPRIKVDDHKLVQMGFNHLLGTGLRRFAYCGFLGHRSGEDRGPAFIQAVRAAGYPVTAYKPSAQLGMQATWQARQRDLMRWLNTLEKPIGILTWNPDIACQLVEAANRAGVRVPDDVAILSGDEDTVKCEISTPSISALEVPSSQIGREAAAVLDRMMRGQGNVPPETLVNPAGVLHMRSSTAITDATSRDVFVARKFIQQHVSEPITTTEIARHAAISRRSLERRFMQIAGHSVHDEIQLQRMNLAREMLLQTALPVRIIAQRCGFRSDSHFVAFFRQNNGITPAHFRIQHRGK